MRVLVVTFTMLSWASFSMAQTTASVDEVRRIQQEAVVNPADDKKLDAFIATLVESPKGSGFYIVEGDIPMTRDQIRGYLIQNNAGIDKQKIGSKELIVNLTPAGQFDYWKQNERALTYTFDKASFRTDAEYASTRDHLHNAAADWVKVCTECGVSITELSAADIAAGRRPTFVVRFNPQTGGPIAQSFFPSYAESRRILYVYPQYFEANGFDPTGVLRHELGHVLGYRHEHIQNIPGCATEGTSWKPLTPYTPNSVMHYYCGHAGSFDLSIRQLDAEGHRCLYLTGKGCPN
jgi:hypothetical protein